MAKGFYVRSMGILTSLYGLLFGFIFIISVVLAGIDQGFGQAFNISFGVVALVAFIFLGLQFLISPWIMDLQLRWIYDMSWVDITELPQSMANAIHQTTEKHDFNIGKIGIIHDGMPNAFTYGRFRNGARIVFTQGIIDLLDPAEQAAVAQHELGHIKNYDFAFMTLASAIPLLFYYFYRLGKTFGARISTGGSNNKAAGSARATILGLAALSYVIYVISRYIVLLLSRYREHAADTFSAHATGEPGTLSSALVKIAYGLVTHDQKIQQELNKEDLSQKRRSTLQNRKGYGGAISSMGLADVNTSRGLVMQAASGGGEVSAQTVAKAATWDLKTPWAKFIELSSTHPLTGKRLKAIDEVAVGMGKPRKYPDLGKVTPPESLWDEFLVDLFVQYVVGPLVIIGPLIGLIIASVLGYNPWEGVGVALIFVSVLWYWRVSIKYPASIDEYTDPMIQKNTVLEALSSMERDGYYEASPVRGKPIAIEGTVGGRGQPGYILSEDFMVRDETGFIVIDYASVIPLYNLWFGWKHVKQMMGQEVRVIGWYHRSTMPYIRLHRLIILDSGELKKNRWRGANLIFTGILFGLGAFLTLGILG